MTQTTLLAALGSLLVSVIVGCGGNVTVDSGSGGEGGGSGTTTGTTTGTVIDPQSYCGGVCTTAQQYGCLEDGQASCVQSCAQIFSEFPDCTSEITALYDCALAQLGVTGCNGASEQCQPQANAMSECMNGGTTTCGTDGCSSSGGSDCSCSGSCNGYELQADCKGTSGAVECNCLVDGQSVGVCKDMELSCDLYGGCCIEYFPI